MMREGDKRSGRKQTDETESDTSDSHRHQVTGHVIYA